ncbi:MAG TPA: two-component system response regulator, partial [Puia sp.]
MIATAPSSGTIPSRLRSNAAPTCHILLAGQDSDELDAVGRQLGGAYCLLKARNDRNALHIIEAQSIHLIIALDDGHRLCAHVKSSIDHAHIPVILLTDGGTVSSRIKCLESGADACLERPVPAPYLKAQIKNLLTNRARIKDYFAHSLYAHMAGMTFSRENEAFLSRLNNLISDNLRNMDLSVDILARLMNMSRPTFYRKIKCLS